MERVYDSPVIDITDSLGMSHKAKCIGTFNGDTWIYLIVEGDLRNPKYLGKYKDTIGKPDHEICTARAEAASQFQISEIEANDATGLGYAAMIEQYRQAELQRLTSGQYARSNALDIQKN